MTRTIFAAALALAVALPAVSALAQAPRTFVSAAGSDSNPCNFAAPCRHFQAAVNATSAGGEVDALDPAGYGPITISQAVTIEGQGWSYIAPPTGGNGITINAGSGNVSVHGVSLNGAGITGSTNGIVFNTGGSLTVTDCKVENFANDGIFIQPDSNVVVATISNTFAVNNGFDGIQVTGANVIVLISNTHALNSGNDGVQVTSSANAGISNTIASNNQNNGFEFHDATTASLFAVRADDNGRQGIYISTSTVSVVKNSIGSRNFETDVNVNSGGAIFTNNNAFNSVIINTAGGATGLGDATNYIGVVSGTLGSQGLR